MAKVNPLSNPKGVKLLCELCQKPAFIQCTKCTVAYYCDLDHQRMDWVGIHEQICQLLLPVRTPLPFKSLCKEREHQQAQLLQRQKHLIELTQTAARKKLCEGRHEEAVPAAMQCLRYSIEVHGLSTLPLILPYLLLAEASIGTGHLLQAEEYLSQAQWTVLKRSECSRSILHKLHRNLGLLYTAKGEFDNALQHLGNDIYYASEEFGTDSIVTSGGYFHMANVFFQQSKMDVADSLYTKVTDIWSTRLSRLVQSPSQSPSLPSASSASPDEALDEAQEAEAAQMLNAIFDIREQAQKQDPAALASASCALAMLCYLRKDLDRAQELGRKALSASQWGADPGFTESIVRFLQRIRAGENLPVPQRAPGSPREPQRAPESQGQLLSAESRQGPEQHNQGYSRAKIHN
ncbi:zinc finger MYND domain-containing protein 12-like isoform X1 [Acipenser ruthenus]|uniref:zinc finger MYND domain-containing protein 12-like isoform X1 n=1 Tax=Acipenser ruthenus TaxID=7906 RepID=UPI002741FE20|nr:zinc finger MYND domain-containing protein 12-like isoform X1 [Acipenser ruthenus]